MIHQLIPLTRSFFVFDTETTGVDPKSDRIVSLGFEQWGPDGLVKEWKTLVNPGVPIPAGAGKVHGITNEAVASSYTFSQLAANLAKGFSNCDFGGKNVRFDLRILSAEMARAGVPWSYVGARIIDAERLEQLAVPRSLSHLYRKYTGEKLEGAHDALNDVRASTIVICKQLEEHSILPRDMDALHSLQWPGMIDVDGKFRFVNGVACFGGWGKYANRPMTAADNGYWDFILKNDFPADVKALASNAKLGRFPTTGGAS